MATGRRPSARYDHCAAAVGSKVVVVGGAEEHGNLNDVHILDTHSLQWLPTEAEGQRPSPRTMHYSALVGSKLYFFGGGGLGSAAADNDQSVYVLETAGQVHWKHYKPQPAPPARHGHSLTAIGANIYLYGGMAGTTLFEDLWVLDTTTLGWQEVATTGVKPGARSGHAAAAVDARLYIHGGLVMQDNAASAADDFYVLDTNTGRWRPVALACAPVHRRLDHTLTTVPIHVGSYSDAESVPVVSPQVMPSAVKFVDITDQLSAEVSQLPGEAAAASVAPASAGSILAPALLLFGGMDLEGGVFNDCLLLRLSETDDGGLQ